jgi:hypothetical protein
MGVTLRIKKIPHGGVARTAAATRRRLDSATGK